MRREDKGKQMSGNNGYATKSEVRGGETGVSQREEEADCVGSRLYLLSSCAAAVPPSL